MKIVNSKSLIKYNTFNVNAQAEFFSGIKNDEELRELLNHIKFKNINKFILGGGSNILITKNITGLVIHNQIKGCYIIQDSPDYVIVEIGAGETWHHIVEWSTNHNLYGIENLSLIPGYVGATPIQNIGAYGSELKDVFVSLDAIDLFNQEKLILNKKDCKFSYRDSIFKNKYKNQFIITKVRLKLSKNNSNINLSYKTLAEKVSRLDKKILSSRDISNLIIQIRQSKLPNPNHIGNAGSFFKNPTVTQQELNDLQDKHKDIPYFQKDNIKIPAGWLIEQLNWKGYRNKSCGVYEHQALVLINHNKATGNEIKELANTIKQHVNTKFNINLEEEVSII